MEHNDSELIKQTLEGDQNAYGVLIKKYQEQIHALAWQKIGDFHIAQEITQDAFITAYKKLNSLKDPQRFSGWLYVITTNLCNMWHRKKRQHTQHTQSFEETDPMELEELFYLDYVSHEREEDRKEMQRSLVKKLLNKLKESDRTVITLHYLAGLTTEEIGEFLGVSKNTVKSRLHRARNRLKNEEGLLQDNLSSFQLPDQLSENIMKQISNLSPAPPSVNKPVMPWVVSSASAFLVVLLIGFGARQLIHFQKPFSLNAESERTIEISEAKQIIDTPEKPAIRNLLGRAENTKRKDDAAQNTDVSVINAQQTDAKIQSVHDKRLDTGKTSLSGVVVDTNGDVVPGLELSAKPIEFNYLNKVIPLTPLSEWARVVTDNQGGFFFHNIDAVSSQLVILPESATKYQIVSIKINDLIYYPPGPKPYLGYWFGNPTISIEPDISLEDTVVTVKPHPMQIRCRLLKDDNTPLTNVQFRQTTRSRDKKTYLFIFPDSESSRRSSRDARTDSDGYFVSYYPEWAKEYSVTIEYKGEKIQSRWFKIKHGKQNDVHVFKLKNTQKNHNNIRERIITRQAQWSVNPENGHAYKRIQCESWNDAIEKATAENAYLVTINNEGEQRWLEGRFGESKFYWIGLSSTQDGASWQWHNGELLTYTNWLENVNFQNDFNIPVALDFFSKRWMPVSSNNNFLNSIKHAIIEKEE